MYEADDEGLDVPRDVEEEGRVRAGRPARVNFVEIAVALILYRLQSAGFGSSESTIRSLDRSPSHHGLGKSLTLVVKPNPPMAASWRPRSKGGGVGVG